MVKIKEFKSKTITLGISSIGLIIPSWICKLNDITPGQEIKIKILNEKK